jgi:aryl-alcohol dehydrogenase-like predicted oxidoreductase
METRKIGSLQVSLCGLGCNNFGARCDEKQSAEVVRASLDAGINFFDTADFYGGGKSEQFLGAALGAARDEVIIATKFGLQMDADPSHAGGSARWVKQAAENSLKRLGTDRIDLYQMHRPDPTVPIEETLEALNDLVAAGKIVEIGNSNFDGAQIEQADDVASPRGLVRFVSAQNHYNLLRREAEDDVIPACERRGFGFLPYYPLASGLLTGKYRRGEDPPEGTRLARVPAERRSAIFNDENFAIIGMLDAFARARGHTLLELAMSWLAVKPVVASVIAGATRPEQVRANANAVSWALTADEQAAIDEISG